MPHLITRHVGDFANECMRAFPALTIQGARQVGKSTLANQLVADRPHVSVTLDDAETLAAAQADPAAFVSQAGDAPMVIDEVQRHPNLLLAVKASIDRNRRPGRFILTGSTNLLQLKGSSDSLAGRATTVLMHTFSQGEILGARDDFASRALRGIDHLTIQSGWDREHYVTAMLAGCYPEARGLTTRMRHAWFDSYVDRLLERDAAALPSGHQAKRIRTLLELAAANRSGELVPARFAEASHIPRNSVTAYLDVLRGIYLVHELPAWTRNPARRVVGRAKGFVHDSGLAARLCRVSNHELMPLTSTTIGGMFEAFVLAELFKQQTWSDTDYRLFHYRDAHGAEVDAIIECADGSIIGVEVKATTTYQAKHFRGLQYLQETFGDRFVAGFVVSMAPNGYQFARDLYGIPATELWRCAQSA